MHDKYQLTKEDLSSAQELFKYKWILSSETIEMLESQKISLSKLLNRKDFEKTIKYISKTITTPKKLSIIDIKKHADALQKFACNYESPTKIKTTYIESKYRVFLNQYKDYFVKKGIVTPVNFKEFWIWFTGCLHYKKSFFEIDIKENDFKLFNEYKERKLEDNRWCDLKEARLLDFFNNRDCDPQLSRNIAMERRENLKIRNRIKKSHYQNILKQYEVYFDIKHYNDEQCFRLFLIWFARCLHPKGGLEDIVINDKEIYYFLQYINIKKENSGWDVAQERERLKERLFKSNKTKQTEEEENATPKPFNIPEYVSHKLEKETQEALNKPGRKKAVIKDAREYLNFVLCESKETFINELKKLSYINEKKEFAHLIMAIDNVKKLKHATKKEWKEAFEIELGVIIQSQQNFNKHFLKRDAQLFGTISKELNKIIHENNLI